MKIYFTSDHAGFELKNELVPFVKEMGHDVEDLGPKEYNEQDDYPDLIAPAAKKVSEAEQDIEHIGKGEVRAVVIGGSGQGEAIVANRFSHVRAALFNGQYQPSDGRDVPCEIEISRTHNDSNVLSLGARFLSQEEAKKALKKWLETPFSGDPRHLRRIKKIEEITNL